MSETCAQHGKMLEKTEFRWVFGIAFIIVGTVFGFFLTNSASSERVESINEKLEYRDFSAEKRAQRLQNAIEKLSNKVDKMDEYLRGTKVQTRHR